MKSKTLKALCALSLAVILSLMPAMLHAGGSQAAGSGSSSIPGLMGFDEAIDAAVMALETNITAGYQVAVYKIDASPDEIGNYLADDLSDRLAANKRFVTLARQAALRYAEAEHQFQMSGLVQDKSVVPIGQYIGAKVVITGDFHLWADFSELRIRAVDVATQTAIGTYPVRIKNNDPILKNITASYGNNTPAHRVAEEVLAHLNRGKDLFREGKFDAAIEEFGKALAIDKELAEAYSYRGTAYGWIGDPDRSITDLNQAIRLNPNDAEAYNNRGVAYADKGDNDNAIADYTQAIRLNPSYAIAYSSRGVSYGEKGDLDKAIADFSQAIRLNPNLSETYNWRGIAYRLKGDLDRDIEDCTQAIRLNPNNADAYNERALAYLTKGDFDRAIADLEAVLRINPNYSDVRRNLDFVRQLKGR